MKAPAAKGASQNNNGSKSQSAGTNLSARSAEAFIDDELTTCLLDNGAQLNFVTPEYAVKQGFQIFTLE